MIYRGCCDRFMRFRRPSVRWRNVHQGYWALSSFTPQKREKESCSVTKHSRVIRPTPLSWSTFDSGPALLFLKSFMRCWCCSSPPPSLAEKGWWTKGPLLTAVRLASPGLFPQSLSSSAEWSIRPNWRWAPSQVKNTKFEPIIIRLYCIPGRTLINSPLGLERMNNWSPEENFNLLRGYV